MQGYFIYRRKIGFVFSFLFLCGEAKVLVGQNLVPNPSFEDTVACPVDKGNVNDAYHWINFGGTLGGTPDYFNACNQFPDTDFIFGCSVPSNCAGFQYAASGDAYAGFINANIYPNGVVDREYIGVKLSDTLKPGVKYFFSFKVSPAYKIPDILLSLECFSNNVGLKFSTRAYSYSNPVPTDNFSHFYYSSILSDTANWLQLNGSYVADSAYPYLIIGNFYDNANSQIVCDSLRSHSASYLYVDDVCVSTDSAYCYDYVYTAMKENVNHPIITIYPNPAIDFVNIAFDFSNESYDINIYDEFGGDVFLKQKVTNPIEHVPIRNTESKILFLKINTKSETFNYKLIKVEP